MAIKDTATDFELPQDNQIIFEDASVADIENMLEGEVELLPIQADTKVSRLPTVETVEMLAEEVPLKPIKAEEITIPQPAASAVSAKMLLGLSALLGGGQYWQRQGKAPAVENLRNSRYPRKTFRSRMTGRTTAIRRKGRLKTILSITMTKRHLPDPNRMRRQVAR